MNDVKPITTQKSRVLEEQRKRKEQARRRQQLELRKKRQRRQKIKTFLMLSVMLVVLVISVAGIVKLLSTNEEPEKVNTPATNAANEVNISDIKFSKDDYIYTCDAEILEELSLKVGSDEKIKFIYDNYKAYPENVLNAVAKNSELVDFAIKYPFEVKKEHTSYVDIAKEYIEGEVPLFIQWDDRWSYYSYGDDVIGTTGCGPTCLSMVVVALTGKTQYTPIAIADFAMSEHYYSAGAGTAWSLFNEGVKKLGLEVRTVGLSETSMADAVNKGEMLVLSMGPGIFTSEGHYIVIYKYQDGKFYVKDPNSKIRSNKTYTFDEFSSQIKNIWAIKK